ncbi:MAG TPA: phosphoribosylglycinamide formyltransferase [Nitrososphaerales archaeon]|nr:phosphoribosylglycinamide formyltransferase [Nitrososphaerales archaeon]
MKCNQGGSKNKKILVLASGRGTDFQAIVEHEKLGVFSGVHIEALVCNHYGALVTEKARKEGIRVYEFEGVAGKKFASAAEREDARATFDRECVRVAKENSVDYIALAGFDQIVSSGFVEEFPFKILNIHPAYDLQRFGGKNMVGLKVHEHVIKSGASYSGCTVHFVTNELDLGPAILKKKISVRKDDTPESLERRILALEHLAYPEAIQLLADDRVILSETPTGTRCFIDAFSGGWDVDWSSRQSRYLNAHDNEARILNLSTNNNQISSES